MNVTAPRARAKHVPERTCVGCRQTAAKRQLIRIVRGDRVEVDPTGKKPGRGAYVCSQRSCWEAALSKSRLERALRTKLSPEDRQRIQEYARTLEETA
jgi:predicted RNA-binding protein YlxR (DUF448 family)